MPGVDGVNIWQKPSWSSLVIEPLEADEDDTSSSRSTASQGLAYFPLNDTPIEIFIEIIDIVLALEEHELGQEIYGGPPRTDLHIRRLQELATVSKGWADVIKGTPSFWNFLHSKYPQDVIATVLRKSQAYPLTIMGEETADVAFVDTAISHFDRWSTVYLNLSESAHFTYLESNPAPLTLTALSIGCSPPASYGYYNLFGGSSSHLQYLQLSHFLIPPKSGLLSATLTTLKLLGVRGWTLSANGMLDVLACTPNLAEFEVRPYGDVVQDVDIKHIPTVVLPQLRRLTLSIMALHAALVIHTAIVAPMCTHLSIMAPESHSNELYTDPSPESPANIPDAWVTKIGAHYAEQLASGILVLDIRPKYLYWGAVSANDLGVFLIIYHQNDPGALLQWITRTWDRKWAQLPFVLRLGIRYQFKPSLTKALSSLPSLKAIKARCPPAEVLVWLRYLAVPQLSKDGKHRSWQCPALERIDIKVSSDTLDEVIRQLGKRYGLAASRNVPQRVPLRILKLQSIEDDDTYAMSRTKDIEMSVGDNCTVVFQDIDGDTMWESEGVDYVFESDASDSDRSSDYVFGDDSDSVSEAGQEFLEGSEDSGEDLDEDNQWF